jgi:hypothetical protein
MWTPERMNRKDNHTPAVYARARTAPPRPFEFRFAVFLLACLCLTGCAVDHAGAVDSTRDLNSRLRDLAFSRLDGSRPLTPAARQALLEFVDRGARRLENDGATPERIAAAETNLGRFVAVLQQESNRLTLREIDLDTISVSRKNLCPFYPFC